MNIHLAGFYRVKNVESKFNINNIYVLSSFYECLKNNINFITSDKHLLDSGAFSFMNALKNKKVDWEEYINKYANYINKYDIKYFFELDIDSIIGIKGVEYLRKTLESQTNKQCIPVWHKSRGIDYWEKMLKEYNYVSIGGIVTKEIKASEYKYMAKMVNSVTRKGFKVHGLGFTNTKWLKIIKFYSVDSTNWLSGRFGSHGYYLFKENHIQQHSKPLGKRKIDINIINEHNFKEWVKFQKYAEANL